MAAANNQITAPRVDFLDKDGRISREWYMFLYNLYALVGTGTGVIPVTSGGTGVITIPTDGQLLIGNGTGYTLNTLGTGSGISVANGAGTITVANTGVLSNIAGAGISVSGATGNVTIANTGVLSAIAGSGISVSSATGNITFANTGVLSFSGGTTGLTPVAAAVGVVVLGGTLIAANGGTGFASYAVGDLLYADTTTTLAKLADVATGNALISGGVSTAPSWGKIGLTTHVDGVLPIANGGTNATATPIAGAVAYGTGTAYAFTAAGSAGQVLTSAGAGVPIWTTNAGGDVTGPASSTDNAIARFDGTTGKLIQNSVTTIDDTGNASGILSQQFSNGSAVTLAAGKMWYDGSTGSWNLGMGNGNITQQVGEEIFVYGKASAAITDSPLQIIYHTGVVGASGVIKFAPTIAGITDVNAIIGIATESLALNDFGRATVFGVVRGITTNGTAFGETWADDDVIWYNPVTGNPTKVEPVAPYIKVQVGLVIKAGSGGSGSFQVNIARGSTLGGTDSNVQFSALANSNLIQYNSTLGYWTNVTPASVTGVGSVANAVTFNNGGAGAASGTTFDGSVARTISYNTVGAQVAGTYVTSVSGTSGRITSTGGTTPVIDLASGVATPGTTGSSTLIPVVTIDTYGRVTSITTAANPQGTVTSVSVVSANGLAGTVATATTTPAITLSTSITGILKGNGTAISAATSGTDYAPATSGTSILYGNGSGGFSNVTVGSGLSFSAGTLAATTSAPSAPVTQTANFTVAATDVWTINNKSGSTCTVTLPTASANSGRVLYFQNYQAQALVSASSNVVPLAGGSAATSILLASSGDSATLVSNGTNWLMTQYIPNNILLLG
jgi:hypothetical protein